MILHDTRTLFITDLYIFRGTGMCVMFGERLVTDIGLPNAPPRHQDFIHIGLMFRGTGVRVCDVWGDHANSSVCLMLLPKH